MATNNMSQEQVHCVLANTLSYIRSGKRSDLAKKPSPFRLNSLPDGWRSRIAGITRNINNSYYTEKDLILFSLCLCIANKSINIKMISDAKPKEIRSASKLFTREQLEKDKTVVRKAIEGGILESVKDLFAVKPNGEPIAFRLIRERTLSPYFFLKFSPMHLTEEKQECIFDKSQAFQRFERIIEVATNILHTGGIYAEEKV